MLLAETPSPNIGYYGPGWSAWIPADTGRGIKVGLTLVQRHSGGPTLSQHLFNVCYLLPAGM